MKLIFLDIDGPLNNARTLKAFPGQYNKIYDQVGVGLLNDLVEDSGAKVVLSSSKRKGAHYAPCIEALKNSGAKFEIYAITGSDPEGVRGREIKAYMEGLDVSHYCIIDDDSDMLLEQMPHFVQVHFNDGITYKNYMDARRILDVWG